MTNPMSQNPYVPALVRRLNAASAITPPMPWHPSVRHAQAARDFEGLAGLLTEVGDRAGALFVRGTGGPKSLAAVIGDTGLSLGSGDHNLTVWAEGDGLIHAAEGPWSPAGTRETTTWPVISSPLAAEWVIDRLPQYMVVPEREGATL